MNIRKPIKTNPFRNFIPPVLKTRPFWQRVTGWLALLAFIAFLFWTFMIAVEGVAYAKEAPIALRHRTPKVEPVVLTVVSSPKTPLQAKSRPTVYGSSAIERLIISEMEKAGYKSPLFALRVAKCESGLNQNAVGDHGHSFGIWQIYLPAHPDITKAQALDPLWSTRWSAHMFAKGYAHRWTCARLLSSL